MLIDQVTASVFKAGNGSVGTAAQRVASLGAKACFYVLVRAAAANSGTIYVNDTAQVASTHGFHLAAGEEVKIQIDSIDKVWVIGSGADQAYSWLNV